MYNITVSFLWDAERTRFLGVELSNYKVRSRAEKPVALKKKEKKKKAVIGGLQLNSHRWIFIESRLYFENGNIKKNFNVIIEEVAHTTSGSLKASNSCWFLKEVQGWKHN